MAVDIEEGDAVTVKSEGVTRFYVLTVAAGHELEASVFQHTKEDLVELKAELKNALSVKRTIILLRANASLGVVKRWETLEPGVFAGRLPDH
ncbi:MAG: hypothetical protein WBW47_02770 [Thermoplasmata archaeon]